MSHAAGGCAVGDLVILGAATVALCWATVIVWRDTKARERMAARLDASCAAMDRAMTDDQTCEVCRQPAAVRELVTLHDGATVACQMCAAVLTGAA